MSKKKIFVPNATKVLLTLTSLAGTVGLWNLISNQSLVSAQQADNTVDGPLVLAPMPTVVPLVQVTPSVSTTLQDASTSQSVLRQVAPQQGGYSPSVSNSSSAPVILPGPVTTTSSSKK